MKYSLGGNKIIEFKTDYIGLDEVAPVKPSSAFTPQWFRSMQDYIEIPAMREEGKPNYFGKPKEVAKKYMGGTVKRCPAIVDQITEGFIIPMWADFLIQRDMDNFEWDNKGIKAYGIEFHSPEQIGGWKLKKTDYPHAVKFVNPWRIYTPPGYSVMFLQPTYQFERRFTVLPGIVETDSYHSIHFPTVWHTTKDAIIERGTPFIQVIPFKRSKWKSQISLMDTEDMRMEGREKNILNTKFRNAYRDIVARNKNARTNK